MIDIDKLAKYLESRKLPPREEATLAFKLIIISHLTDTVVFAAVLFALIGVGTFLFWLIAGHWP